jgi:D-3-phosphoglycerate dehydrogenase
VDNFEEDFFEELTEYGDVIKVANIRESVDLEEVEILVIRSKTRVDRELVDKMHRLRCVISTTHGKDHVDLDYLKEKNVGFHNVPVQAYDIAQGVMAYIFAFTTNLVSGDKSMKNGVWKKKELIGFRIKGKTLGIIGLGRIGEEVVKIASSFGMRVVVYDPYIKAGDKAVTLDELLEVSDFVTLHVPLNEETRSMIGKDEIAKMKNGAYLINTARGGVVDEGALLSSLLKGKLGGAALDVYEKQPLIGDNTSSLLVRNQRVISTPHSIGQTNEAVKEKGDGAIDIIRQYIEKHE